MGQEDKRGRLRKIFGGIARTLSEARSNPYQINWDESLEALRREARIQSGLERGEITMGSTLFHVNRLIKQHLFYPDEFPWTEELADLITEPEWHFEGHNWRDLYGPFPEGAFTPKSSP